jgi:hypothetical protein
VADTYKCAGVTRVVADTGDGSDYVSADAGPMAIPMTVSGGPGADILFGGEGADVLNGGAGEDYLFGGAGADRFTGGSGIDYARYAIFVDAPAPPPVTITLDGVADDGTAGEGKNFGVDIEDVDATVRFDPGDGGGYLPGGVTVTGSAAANVISGADGPDTLTGGAGNDLLYDSGGDDTVNARDGFADRVYCGSGVDSVIADTLDVVSDECENVSIADVGIATEDKPPSIAWVAPAAGAKLSANKPTTLQVTATDDKGVTQVQFLDDDRVACTDTTAPYTCDYRARGDDVGRNTLVAIASDAAGQSASTVRTALVKRFSAKPSLKVSPRHDARAPYSFTASGKLSLSPLVSPKLGCKGVVKVTVKAGSKRLATRTAKLSKRCTYRVKLELRGVAGNGKLQVRAAFAGNDIVAGKRSAQKTVATK